MNNCLFNNLSIKYQAFVNALLVLPQDGSTSLFVVGNDSGTKQLGLGVFFSTSCTGWCFLGSKMAPINAMLLVATWCCWYFQLAGLWSLLLVVGYGYPVPVGFMTCVLRPSLLLLVSYLPYSYWLLFFLVVGGWHVIIIDHELYWLTRHPHSTSMLVMLALNNYNCDWNGLTHALASLSSLISPF